MARILKRQMKVNRPIDEVFEFFSDAPEIVVPTIQIDAGQPMPTGRVHRAKPLEAFQ